MTDKTDKAGGPAFPQGKGIGDTWVSEGGMTMRDYFAAKAMQGLLAQSMGSALSSDPDTGAQYAYRMADAMIKEREK